MEKSPETPDEIVQSQGTAVGETNNLKFQHDVHDQGVELFQEVPEYSAEELEAASAKVKSLIDWHIMPIVSPSEF